MVEASATCAIKQQRNPLILHIHGEGLTTHSQLAIEQTDGNLLLLSSQTTKTLDFGQVYLLNNSFAALVVTCRTQHESCMRPCLGLGFTSLDVLPYHSYSLAQIT